MLGGQKAPYKLLVRAVDQRTGLEIPSITFVASEDFVVRSCLCFVDTHWQCSCDHHMLLIAVLLDVASNCSLPCLGVAGIGTPCERFDQE